MFADVRVLFGQPTDFDAVVVALDAPRSDLELDSA